MAKISEILEIEKDRSETKTWNVVHLFKDGGFYRAYEWSAWLIVAFAYDDVRKDNVDRKPLNVTRKKIKNGDGDFVFVGFPMKSLEKFMPNNKGFIPISDTQVNVKLKLSTDDTDLSYEEMLQ